MLNPFLYILHRLGIVLGIVVPLDDEHLHLKDLTSSIHLTTGFFHLLLVNYMKGIKSLHWAAAVQHGHNVNYIEPKIPDFVASAARLRLYPAFPSSVGNLHGRGYTGQQQCSHVIYSFRGMIPASAVKLR